VALKLNVGDTGPDDGSLTGAQPVHQSHSTTMWTDDRGRTFVAATDNLELHDLDFFEITGDPANPRPVAEFDILDRFPEVYDNSAYGDWVYNHDMSVRKVNGVWTLLLNYWDAGYVTLDVTDPADPKYIGDSSFDGADPLTGWDPPEGNAHQGEFSHDGKYILAADEDFDTYRLVSEIDGDRVDFGFGVPVIGTPSQLRSDLVPSPGNPIEGDSRYVGEACSLAAVPAPQAGETVAIAVRGTCDFEDKAMYAEQAGYDAVLIMQNDVGAAPRCDATNLNMTTDNVPVQVTAKMLLIPRSIGFRMLGVYDEATYSCNPATPGTNTPTPPVNTAGLPVSLAFEFDGWGYTHVFENGKGKLRRIDSYAIPEGLDERYATGFGDLTVHEFATDPEVNIAYSAYYAAGMRVFSFGAGGLKEEGRYIPERGANFWGVEQFTQNGVRYFAGSDRDYGLYIFRYTGPGGPQPKQPAQPPSAAPRTLAAPAIRLGDLRVGGKRWVRVPVSCAESVAGMCRGKLSLERRNGWTTVAQKWFAKRADSMSSVKLRVKRSEFRRLMRRGRQRVTVELLTRGMDGQLREASARVTLLKPGR
jgi:hypothetical protein